MEQLAWLTPTGIVDPDQLAALRRRLRMQLDEIEHSDGALSAAQEAEAKARAAYDAAAHHGAAMSVEQVKEWQQLRMESLGVK